MPVTLSGQNDDTGIAIGGSGPLQNSTSSFGTASGGSTNYLQPASMAQVLDASTTTSNSPNTGYTVDPAAAAAAAKAAEDARKAAALRGEVTNLVNTIKGIFDQRYGSAKQSAAEQSGKLDTRYQTETGDVMAQVGKENEALGAAHAASGSYDSSYRGNNQDTVTTGGQNQVRDLGTELEENRAKIGGWLAQQEASTNAQKGGLDAIISRLAQTTDLNELTTLRNSIEARQAELAAGGADNNTQGQNIASLNAVAPTSARAVQLKTTLSQIVAGKADKGQKAAIGQKIIASAGLSPEDQAALSQGFQAELAGTDPQQLA